MSDRKPSRHLLAKCGVTLIALGVATLHILNPALKVDAVTVALLVVASLPWFYEVIESAKLPGGYEIKFRDLAKAGEKVDHSGTLESVEARAEDAASNATALERVQSLDPNLAVVGLRIEIEKCIRQIAAAHAVPNTGGLSRLVNELVGRQVLRGKTADGLRSLIELGNEAAHGASVEPAAAEWAISNGQKIINVLRNLAGDGEAA